MMPDCPSITNYCILKYIDRLNTSKNSRQVTIALDAPHDPGSEARQPPLKHALGGSPSSAAMRLPPGCLAAPMQSSNIKKTSLLPAAGGDAVAQLNLGVLCDSGLDDDGHAIKGNRAEAVKWLLAAANRAALCSK